MLCGAVAAADPTTELVTTGPTGTGGNQGSEEPDVSDDGNIITFQSQATDLINGQTPNIYNQIYTYDRTTQTTTLITPGTTGTGGNTHSYNPAISGNGNIITFQSQATDLINGQTPNGYFQIYAYDRTTQTTTLITPGTTGTGGNTHSYGSAISGDGNIIFFTSGATDLINGFTPNGQHQIYAYDRTTQTTTLITPGTTGTGGNTGSSYPTISGNGNIITFQSTATNLINGFTPNGLSQIYAYDRTTQTTTLISPGTTGTGGNQGSYASAISGDGNIITFTSTATNLINGFTPNGLSQIYAYDRTTQTTTLITPGTTGTGGNTGSSYSTISGNGNMIIFQSEATDLINGQTPNGYFQIYAYDRTTQTTTLITPGTTGTGGNQGSVYPAISGNGNIITFYSTATDLINGLTPNRYRQVYVVAFGGDNPDHNSSSSVSSGSGTGLEAQAARNTVVMQNTGTPIAGILLAILMVLGGFINTRKKQ